MPSLNLLLYNYCLTLRWILCVLMNSKRHTDRRGAEVNMIKFTVQ